MVPNGSLRRPRAASYGRTPNAALGEAVYFDDGARVSYEVTSPQAGAAPVAFVTSGSARLVADFRDGTIEGRVGRGGKPVKGNHRRNRVRAARYRSFGHHCGRRVQQFREFPWRG